MAEREWAAAPGRLRRRIASTRDERGAVIVVVALSMTVLMAATALSFDIGREVDENRTVQAVADAAALDAANFLTGSANSPTLDSSLTTQAVDSATRNGFTTSSTQTVTTTPGTWTVAGGFSAVSPSDSTTIPDAVQVSVAAPTTFVFLPGTATSTRRATAVRQLAGSPPPCPGCQGSGALTPDAALTVGSFIVGVDTSQSALLNGLLGGALGTTLNLSAVGYQGLAAADINMNDILSANAGVGT
ncbi:MAG: pilus assembly protein TadG-related protein, partial [Acidimicrobiales bacterium]